MEDEKPQPNVEVIDDLSTHLIKAGGRGDTTYFAVSGHVLRVACPSWYFLYETSETDPEPGRKRLVVPLHNVNAAAVRVVLLIAYHKHKEVPEKLDFGEIAQLAKLCSQYGLSDLVHLYAQQWLRSCPGPSINEEICFDHLWIHSAFGAIDSFTKIVSLLTTAMSEAQVRNDSEMPPGCQKLLSRAMSAQRRWVLDRAQTVLDEVINSVDICRNARVSKKDKEQCNLQRLGAICMFFKELQVPFTRTGNALPHVQRTTSLDAIRERARSMEKRAAYSVSRVKHARCHSKISAFVNELDSYDFTIGDMNDDFKKLYETLQKRPCSVGEEQERLRAIVLKLRGSK